MKSTFFIIFFTIFQLSFAQYESVQVIYKTIQINEKKDLDIIAPKYRKAADKMLAIIDKLEFALVSNRNEAVFSLNKNLAIDKDEYLYEIAVIAARADRLIYTNYNQNLMLEQFEPFGKTLLIKSKLNDIKWSLANETKNIEGYKCYKATAVLINKDQKNEDLKFDLTAWYVPELSFNFGPFESSGLPGLVLEFSNGKLVVVASKIQLSKDALTIDRPIKGKVVTREEFNQIGRKAVEAIQN